MRLTRALCRLVFGLTFIFSGFVKLLSPVGTSLIMQEYFSAMHLNFLSGISMYAGLLLAICEFTIGMCILLSVRIKFFAAAGFYLCLFFTLLTLCLALFNPISDCGCFGEAIHLTNWQTFFKNLILLPGIALLFFQRKKIPPIANHVVEWAFVAFFGLVSVAIWLHSLLYVPVFEFTPYKIGSFVSDEDEEVIFETTFIYAKDGRQESFTLDNLPDSSWTYVDTRTEMRGDTGKYSDFIIQSAEGYDISQLILTGKEVVLVSIYDPARLSDKYWQRIRSFCEKVTAAGAELYVAASVTDRNIPEDFPFEVRYGDRKLLLTINRANGGATLFSDGYIVQKWTAATMEQDGLERILEQDGETLILRNTIKSNVMMSCLMVGIILSMLLIYYICKVAYKGSTINRRS